MTTVFKHCLRFNFGSAAASVAAHYRGRDAALWFVLAIFTGCFALIFVLIVTPNKTELEKRAIEKGDKKRCKTCKELVHVNAIKCPYCTTSLMLEYVENNN